MNFFYMSFNFILRNLYKNCLSHAANFIKFEFTQTATFRSVFFWCWNERLSNYNRKIQECWCNKFSINNITKQFINNFFEKKTLSALNKKNKQTARKLQSSQRLRCSIIKRVLTEWKIHHLFIHIKQSQLHFKNCGHEQFKIFKNFAENDEPNFENFSDVWIFNVSLMYVLIISLISKHNHSHKRFNEVNLSQFYTTKFAKLLFF